MLIAQITDLHIVEKDKHWLSEPATEVSKRLARTISYLNGLNPRPDVVLLTGDATEDGKEASYFHLIELLKPLKIPFYAIPGNHDRREAMRSAFKNLPFMPSKGFIHYAVDDYPIRFIGLDTLVEGEDFGCLCDERFSWLDETLKQDTKKPTLLFMHHPPIQIGMELFDQMKCKAPKAFETLISKQTNIMGIVTGHYHHLCVSTFGNKLCFLAPSVAPVHYFAGPKDLHVTALELEDPGVTLHSWLGENTLVSHVVRIKDDYRRIDWARIKHYN